MFRSGKHKPRIIITTGLAIIGLALIGYGAWGLWQSYEATHQKDVAIPQSTVVYSTGTPDETVPTEACGNYQVSSTQPRKIQISTIDVDGCIQKVGLDQNNAIAVPTNIHLAGWYINSALPGQEGNSIIDGHVLGHYDDAIFARLKQLQTDDTIRIQFGDRSWKSFKVIDVQTYTVKQASAELSKQLDGVERQLTLITCTGTFDSRSQTYDQRVIVRAELTD